MSQSADTTPEFGPLAQLSSREEHWHESQLVWDTRAGYRFQYVPTSDEIIMRATQAQGEYFAWSLEQYRLFGKENELNKAEEFCRRALALLARVRSLPLPQCHPS